MSVRPLHGPEQVVRWPDPTPPPWQAVVGFLLAVLTGVLLLAAFVHGQELKRDRLQQPAERPDVVAGTSWT